MAVLTTVKRDILAPDIVREALALAVAKLRPSEETATRQSDPGRATPWR